MSVHVAVDAQNLVRDDRGIGRYARAVLSRAVRLPHVSFTLVVRDWFADRRAFARALGGAEVEVARRIPRNAEVVWFPWNGTFLDTTLPTVATVHDAAPFAYPAGDTRRRATEQTPFLRTAATARTILVQSQFTAREVEQRLGVDPSRIVVTPLAADPAFTPAGDDTATGALAPTLPARLRERPYILHVGAHDERKNTGVLIDAFARAFDDGEMTLAFTRRPPVMPRGGVVVDAANDATLVALYRGATLVAVPSTYEGFGLPMLEAMACGAPVLGARAGALPEVGGDAVEWVDEPLAVDAWSAALRAIVADAPLRDAMRALGLRRASTFSWERCTVQTLAVFAPAARGD